MGDGTAGSRGANRDLQVAFEIELARESDCPLHEVGGDDGDVVEIRQQLLRDQCQTETTVQSDDPHTYSDCAETDVVHSASDVDENCFCAVFGEYDCIPEIVDATDGHVHVKTYLPDRDRLTDLVDALNAVADHVRLQRLRRIDTRNADDTRKAVTLNLHGVTEKQREAVTKAVAAGYYANPRETTLEELADDLGISKSACSQRLNAVEAKLATSAFASPESDG